MNNIFLIGFMGVGKSTIAMEYSKTYGMENVEMDERISERAEMSISDIFAKYGEEYFRNLETTFLRELELETDKIVSCGGGIVLREENISIMKKCGKIIMLTATPQEILERVRDDDKRPLLQGRKSIEAIQGLMEKRRGSYEKAADFIIHTDGKTKEEICEEIMNELQRAKEREENV